MAGIRAQYFEDLEEIAKKTKQQLPNTPGEKLYRMLVGDEETLNGLGAGGWEKVKVGKDESRLVIGKTSKGHKISVAPRLMGGTKLAVIGYTLEGHSAWSDFNSSSPGYVLMHPELDVSLWTNETAQKQLFGQSDKHDGEAYHGRWLARVWRHVFPEADVEGDSGLMSTPSAYKRRRTGREDQAQAGPSTSTGGGRSSNGLQMKEFAATTYKEAQEPEAGLLDSSDDDEPDAERQGFDQALLGKYGLSSAKNLWEAFNKHSSRFQLGEVGMLRLLQRGLRETMRREGDFSPLPDRRTLDRAKLDQAFTPSTLITDTNSFKIWQRRKEGGCTGRIGFIEFPSQFALAKQRAEEKKKKKEEEEEEEEEGSGTKAEGLAGATEKPDDGE
ncbi:hypothetical protein KC343_g1239 [Hortaea werneckii]|nr:hypothetical protein KC352_g6348 [Hortaea werneckii]KAI7571709.1 hypothetical protein KC317_g1399 [Hortaea werneckii]KAI7626614.1 hypothetical protein KC346_g1170 [Hortaea werneckii]KAI7636539.1 hypothetical protein KC343_g1239 [Hortaea werneckii]KAI7682168.1 hypothetical protein KC319_g1161 [Hortaea werneckii]